MHHIIWIGLHLGVDGNEIHLLQHVEIVRDILTRLLLELRWEQNVRIRTIEYILIILVLKDVLFKQFSTRIHFCLPCKSHSNQPDCQGLK